MKEKLFYLLHKLLLPLVLMTIGRVVFYIENYEYYQLLSPTQTRITFCEGIRFDLYIVILINSVFILYILSPFSKYNSKIIGKIFKSIYMVSNTILLLLNFIDVFYYPYIFKRLNTSFFDYLDTQKNMESLNTQFIIDYWYGFILLGAFVYILFKFYPKHKAYRLQLTSKKPSIFNLHSVGNTITVILALCLVSTNYNPLNGFIKPSESHRFIKNPHQKALALNTGYNIWADYLYPEPQLPITQIPNVNLKPLHTTNKNVVILILESFAHEASGYLNPNTTKTYMPFLDELMASSYVFTHAFSNGRQSMDAIPALWNGLPAMERPFILDSKPYTSIPGLPQVLNSAGYTSLFFHGAQNGSMDFDRYAKQNHIKHYYGLNEYPEPIKDFDGTWGIWDEPFLQFTQNTLDTITQPFFATVFTLSSHNPCKVPDAYKDAFSGGSLPIYKSIEYSDYALSNFFKQAKTKVWFKNTLFVITADHSIHPKHNTYKTPENGFAVPLLFYTPANPFFTGTSDRLAQHLDVYPTLLNLLNLKNTEYKTLGNNLFNPYSNKEVINYYNGIYQYQTPDSTHYLSSTLPAYSKAKQHQNKKQHAKHLSDKLGISLYPITH